MYEKTKKQIYNLIKQNTEELDWNAPKMLTTNEISRQMNISRNLCSHYLNEMVKEDELIKISTRPVSFLHRETLEMQYQMNLTEREYLSFYELSRHLGISKKDVFDSYIGANSGLSYQVSKCKVSAGYPDSRLPILIYGEKGAGKHRLAELVGEYAAEKGYSGGRTEFLDASLYKNNPEKIENLLAERLTPGKQNGILCLENVEQIPAETLLRILEISEWKIIFTANRNKDSAELDDLVKQMPLAIELPSLSERSDEDRKELLLHFMKQESIKVKREILIDVRAMELLIQYHYARNVDEMRDIVMTCCANAFARESEKELQICIYDLPEKVMAGSYKPHSDTEPAEMVNIKNYKVNHYLDEFQNFCRRIYERYYQKEWEQPAETEIEEMWKITEEFCDYLTYENRYFNKKIDAFRNVLSGMIDSMADRYGIYFPAGFDLMFAKCLYAQTELAGRKKSCPETGIRECFEDLAKQYEQEQLLVEELRDSVESFLGIKTSYANQVFLLLSLIHFNAKPKWNTVRGVIICHGSATASSMADVVNKVLGLRVFEAIDMPITVSPAETIQRLKKYMKYIKKPRELIILVDMGSLEELHGCLSDVKGLKAIIINNVSTRLAIDTGAKIRAEMELEKIAKNVCRENQCTYRLVDNTAPQKAILFFSETGIGAAKRMSGLFANSLPRKINVEFVSVDYKSVLEQKNLLSIFEKYEVLFIVGTQDPQLPNIWYVSMEDVIGFNQMERVFSVLGQFLTKEELNTFKKNLVKEFSLQNVIQNLTILDAEVLIGMVSEGIEKLQKKLGKNFSDKIRISLNVHVCCLVERLIRKEALEGKNKTEDMSEEFLLFMNAVKESFQNISLHYNVEIPENEIAYIKNYFDYGKEK